MLEGTHVVTTHITNYSIIEQLYPNIDSALSKGLRDSLSKLFVIILKFQILAIKYFDSERKGRWTRLGLNPITAENVNKKLQSIRQAREQVDEDIILVDAEVARRGFNNLKEGQKGQPE